MKLIDFTRPIESFEQAVNEVVALMTMQTPRPGNEMAVDVLPSYFDGAELFAKRYHGWFRSDDSIFFRNTPLDILPKIDVSWISEVIGENQLIVARMRKIERKEARGRVHQCFRRYLMEGCIGNIPYDGRFTSGRNYFTSDDGKYWIAIGDTKRLEHGPRPAEPELMAQLALAPGIALTQHYEWRVTLGYHGCVSIGLPTTPAGCREVFKLRDIPEGKARREALRNFVCEHTRKHPATDDEEARIVVREHLRGSTRFNWNGLRCTIHPAQADLIRLGLTRK
jgi:hypothetical protein